MALINCPECSNTVSTLATTCPHCGIPLAQIPGKNLKIVQHKNKRLKKEMMMAVVTMMVGIAWLVAVKNMDNPESPTIPALIIEIGAIWFLVAKMGLWWHSK